MIRRWSYGLADEADERVDLLLESRGFRFVRPTKLLPTAPFPRLLWVGGTLALMFGICGVLWWRRHDEPAIAPTMLFI